MKTWRAILAVLLITTCAECSIDEEIEKAALNRKELAFQHDSHSVLVELDMLFNHRQWRAIQQLSSDRPTRKAIRSLEKRWPQKLVPYQFDSSAKFSKHDASIMNQAITDWMKYTCIRFRPATANDRNRIIFKNGGGCSSHVGMQGGSQSVTLAPGCRKKGIVIHEIGHAIGFFHEQSRPDRDKYVAIAEHNVKSKNLHNFRKYSTAIINTYHVPYDYSSVMHYGEKYFSKNGLQTIVTRDPKVQHKIGQREGLTFEDIHLANLMYNCSSQCPMIQCPKGQFLGKDCRCWCRGKPINKCSPPVTARPTPRPTSGTVCKEGGFKCKLKNLIGLCRISHKTRRKCPFECGLCQIPNRKCKDRSKVCGFLTILGCKTRYVKLRCTKSCRLCGNQQVRMRTSQADRKMDNQWRSAEAPPQPPVSKSDCRDKSAKLCKVTSLIGCRFRLAKSHCRESCGFCPVDGKHGYDQL